MLVFGAIYKFDQVLKKIFSLLFMPTVEPLIRGNPKYSVGKENLKGVLARIDHAFRIVQKPRGEKAVDFMAKPSNPGLIPRRPGIACGESSATRCGYPPYKAVLGMKKARDAVKEPARAGK